MKRARYSEPAVVVAWLFVALVPSAAITSTSLQARENECAICDGRRKIPCPKCDGGREQCDACENSGKVVCRECLGKGVLPCKVCAGKGGDTCSRCAGKRKIWVKRKYVWEPGGKNGKGGLRKVIPAHWEPCTHCKKKGRILCRACRGKGARLCGPCKGKRSVSCPACKKRGVDRRPCAACGGKGLIACPRCLHDENNAGRPPPDKVDDVVLNDLHWALDCLERKPLLLPLLALTHVGSLEEPLGIVVLREALQAKHPWIRVVALEELSRFQGMQLAKIGGRDLVVELIKWTRSGDSSSGKIAEKLLEAISKHSPDDLYRDGVTERWLLSVVGFPEGRDLPELSAPRRAGDEEPRGAGEDGGDQERTGKTTVAPRPKASPSAEAREFYLGAERAARNPIDLVWAIDCSGSVRPHFANMRDGARITSRLIAELLPSTHVGLIAYRDRVEARLPVTDNLERFHQSLRRMRADKGGGFPEGVDVALEVALSQKRMALRPRSDVAVVIVGDEGPEENRTKEMTGGLEKLRKREPRFRVHCVNVADPRLRPRVQQFWKELAAAGGGTATFLYPRHDFLEDLCTGMISSVNEKVLRRVLRPIIRAEGWADGGQNLRIVRYPAPLAR